MKTSATNIGKIRIEKIERIVLPKILTKFCELCGNEKTFIPAETAGFYFGLTAREVFRLVETDAIHFYESANGALFVCTASMTELNFTRI